MKVLSKVYPIVFATTPVLSLYAHNIGQVTRVDALLPLASVVALAVLLLVVFHLLLRDSHKSALLASLSLLLCFTFPTIQGFAQTVRVPTVSLAAPTVLLSILGALVVVTAIVLTRTKRDLMPVTKILAVVSLTLLAIPLFRIVLAESRSAGNPSELACTDHTLEPSAPATGGTQRDIYYIILDRYPDERVLRDHFGFDNSEFLAELRDSGFYVARRSFSNYMVTSHSLASSLNMDYINCLEEKMGEESNDWQPLFSMLEDYRVWRLLKSRGYRFIHVGSGWHPTSRNKNADENYNYYLIPEFTSLFFRSTAALPFLTKLGLADPFVEKRRRVEYEFEKLAEIPEIEGPTFTFAHFLLPHFPYVFDSNGTFVPPAVANQRSKEDNLVRQLRYTNTRVLSLVTELIANSDPPPIIILQGDEGPYPKRSATQRIDWRSATPEECQQKVRILNAYYLPGVDTSVLYPSITPVNSFRVLFNLYFGADYELLPDECFAYADVDHLYSFVNITEHVR